MVSLPLLVSTQPIERLAHLLSVSLANFSNTTLITGFKSLAAPCIVRSARYVTTEPLPAASTLIVSREVELRLVPTNTMVRSDTSSSVYVNSVVSPKIFDTLCHEVPAYRSSIVACAPLSASVPFFGVSEVFEVVDDLIRRRRDGHCARDGRHSVGIPAVSANNACACGDSTIKFAARPRWRLDPANRSRTTPLR